MEHSDAFPPCFYRVSIKGMCVRDGKLLLVRESNTMSGQWELPGGGLDFGENPTSGIVREVKEEMGLTVSKISTNPIYMWTQRREKKRQLDWYYTCVVAHRMELENLDFTPSDECVAVEFFSKDELQDADLHQQISALRDIFNPEDFKVPFV